MKHPRVNLEQWLCFQTVVDEGSFAKAAEVLNKSQSTISYNIAKLEANLPTALLETKGRKATLTKEGEILYRKAKQLLSMASDIEQVAHCLSLGWETEVILNADSIVPLDTLLSAINQFSTHAPTTRVTLLETTLSGTTEVLLEKKADIVISAQTPPGFMGTQLGVIKMIPVAHANHPLNRTKNKITGQELVKHRQIVVRDSGNKQNQDQGWLDAEQRLTVSHFAQSTQAIKLGMGFAFTPEHYVDALIKNGELKRLNLEENGDRLVPIYLTMTSSDREGVAVKSMRDILIRTFIR